MKEEAEIRARLSLVLSEFDLIQQAIAKEGMIHPMQQRKRRHGHCVFLETERRRQLAIITTLRWTLNETEQGSGRPSV